MSTYREIEAACQRLDRFRPHRDESAVTIQPAEAIDEVTLAMEFPGPHRPTVTADDLAAAAVLLDNARTDAIYMRDYRELQVLDGLCRAGWSMQQIGERLGYAPRTAAAQAKARMNRLHRKIPGFKSAPITPTATQETP